MPYQQVLGIIAGILSFISFLPYIASIFKGQTKPQRATYAIWTLVTVLTFSSYLSVGATYTIWIIFSCMIMQIIVFILSFKYGMGGFGKLDIVCLSLAAIAAALWAVTKQPQVALYLSIFLEFLGFVTVIKKSYLFPKTENALAWEIAAFAQMLNIFAVTSFVFDIAFYPTFIFVLDLIVVYLLVIHPKTNKNTIADK